MTAFAAAGDSGTLAASITAPTWETLASLSTSPTSPSDTSIAAAAKLRERERKRGARLGLAIAADKESYILLRQAPSARKLGIFEQPKAEMGIADRAR